MSELKTNIKWLISFYRPLKRRLLLIAGQSVIVAAFAASIPVVYSRIIDGIEENLSSEYLVKAVGVLLILGISNFLFSVTNATRRAKTNLDLEWFFRQKTFQRLIKLDQRFFDRFRTGDVVTRLTDDVGRKLSWFACSGIFRAWESILRVLFCLIAMSLINPLLTLLVLVPFPVQIVVYLKSVRVLDRRFRALQDVISRVNDTIETCFSGIKIIQAYCAENRQALKYTEVAEERAEAEVHAEKAHIFVHQLYGYFWQLAQVIVLIAGGWLVINNRLTIGEFVAFDYYILFLVWPMFDIGGLLVGYRRASVSIRRIRELEEFRPSVREPEHASGTVLKGNSISFHDVTFFRGNYPVLKDISFDSERHRMIAIVGGVGAGKSSLLQLICRFFDPDSGSVRLDGIDLRNLSLEMLRNRIGYVSQEPLLFSDTIANNIRFGRSAITDEKIRWAAEVAQLSRDLKEFKDGFDTYIGLRGMTISGGQKQRISIARALAGEPEILVLDDATAHLDAETEDALWNRIYEVLPKMRTFVSSHRTSTLERADLILVLKEGEIVDCGRHQTLVSENGEYNRLYFIRKHHESMTGNGRKVR